ncbi:hypothetical protein XENORESO_021013, partial [Xenotaenia resolanae]
RRPIHYSSLSSIKSPVNGVSAHRSTKSSTPSPTSPSPRSILCLKVSQNVMYSSSRARTPHPPCRLSLNLG